LLEILKSDGQGQGNFYILRTPYFEKDSIIGDSDAVIARQERILYKTVKGASVPTGYKLPETFLEDNHLRLKRQVKKNRARKLRDVARNAELQKKNPALYKEFKSNATNRTVTWHKIVKKLGSSKAAAFNNIVFDIIRKLRNVESGEYWKIFKERLKAYLTEKKIVFDAFLLDYGVELAAFYDSRRADPKRPATETPQTPPAAPMPFGDERGETEDFLIRVLEAKRKGEKLKTLNENIEQLAAVFKRAREFFSLSELEAIAKRYLPANEWQKITVEMRT